MLQGSIPISQRVYHSKYYTSTEIGTYFGHGMNRIFGCKEWTYDKMAKAIRVVTDDGMSIRQAAKEFNVPKFTLRDQMDNALSN